MVMCRVPGCAYEAPNVIDLQSHYISVHRYFMCIAPDCGTYCTKRADLDTHIAEIHQHRRWECTTCHYIYRRRGFYVHRDAKKKPRCKGATYLPVYLGVIGNFRRFFAVVYRCFCRCIVSFFLVFLFSRTSINAWSRIYRRFITWWFV